MPKWGQTDDTICPVARSTAILGDRWTMLFLRELFTNCTTFEEIQAQTGATPQMVATRLKRLEKEGIVERRAYSKRPVRHEYLLTEKGRALFTVIVALRNWGEAWCKGEDEPLAAHFVHRACGTELDLDSRCPACDEVVSAADLDATPSRELVAEREERLRAFKSTPRSPRNAH